MATERPSKAKMGQMYRRLGVPKKERSQPGAMIKAVKRAAKKK